MIVALGCPPIQLLGSGPNQHLTGRLESVVPLEPAERFLDLLPGGFAIGLVQPRQHLVQGAKRLPFEADALGGRGQA
jgi:hypothetical protein